MTRIPGVSFLAELVARLASRPAGFLVLLPIAIALDAFDVIDELALGPVGMVLSFVLESAFLLGLTGRASYSLVLSGLDLIPGLDLLPLATITLLRTYMRERSSVTRPAGPPHEGPVIDI